MTATRAARALGLTLFLAMACGAMLLGCGGQERPAQAPPAAPSAAEPAASPAVETASTEVAPAQAATGASAPPPSAATDSSAQVPAADNTKPQTITAPKREGRDVIYRVSPEGLLVEVAGVRFAPSAKAVKRKDGGYGIELTVEAEAIDDGTHVVVSPKHGPLALAATLYRKGKGGSERAHHADRRQGGEQEFLVPGASTTFSRQWPSGEVKGPIWWGERVRLQVGLWGLSGPIDGENSHEGQPWPVRKLFVVEMVAGSKARAIISPPDLKSGK